ncbi:MAG: hypothetical protein VX211_07110, partial [Pseudomonadota bacterium]|nr:hypothetical protein [Pseudomonadota bacterium]
MSSASWYVDLETFAQEVQRSMQGIKRITVLLMSLGLLVACSPNEAESIAPATEPSMVAGAPAEGAEETAPNYYVEFMWCWAGESATEDTVAALLAD